MVRLESFWKLTQQSITNNILPYNNTTTSPIPIPMSSYTPRPPLIPWSADTWSKRWASQGRRKSLCVTLCPNINFTLIIFVFIQHYLNTTHTVGTTIPRTPFLLLKAPVSTLYEEKFGGDRNMFTGKSFCTIPYA